MLGLEALGWVVTAMPRKGDKYGGQVFMSADEVMKAATFQHKYQNKEGTLKTIVLSMDNVHVDYVIG